MAESSTENELIARITAERENDWPPAMLALFAVAILAAVTLVYVAFEAGEHGGRIAGEPARFDQHLPIRELDVILSEPAVDNLVGRQVLLDRVEVDRVVGDFVFWIGDRQRGAVPVVLLGEQTGRQAEGTTEVREGQEVQVVGVIRALVDLDVLDRGMLDDMQRRALANNAFFIGAEQVEIRDEARGALLSDRASRH